MGLPLKTVPYYDNSGGLDLKSSLTKTDEDDSTASLNVDYATDGAVYTRYGSSILNSSQMDQLVTRGLYDYKKSDGTQVAVLQAGSKIKTSVSAPSDAVTGLDASAFPDFDFQVTGDDEYLIWGNGVNANLKYNGTIWTNLSLPRATAPTAADNGVGVLGAGDYYYYVEFARTVAGVIVQQGELSPISAKVTIGANRQIRVTIPTCTETLAAGVTAQCNARVIYRVSPTSAGVAYRLTTVADNVTVTYDDNTLADGTIEADFDNQAAPTTGVFETYLGRTLYADGPSVFWSPYGKPWKVPITNEDIFDGKVNCIFPAYGAILVSTDNDTLWVYDGDPDTNRPRQISHGIGVLNNRCFGGEGRVYIFASNRKVYSISPTDFSQREIRINEPLSIKIEPLISQIPASASDKIFLKYFTSADQGKVFIACPITSTNNNCLIIYNETQSIQKQKNVWQFWDNLNVSAMEKFVINGSIYLYSGDYNGYLWKLLDTSKHGDGAEENGTATSGGASTLTDLTKAWVVNAYKGISLKIIEGTGVGQSRTIASNTADTLTISTAFSTQPDSTSKYTIGGYINYHFTNWKSVTGSYDTLKQLWFFISNLNASGDYTIQLIIQYYFDTTETNQTVLNINLQSSNSIWGNFFWLQANWGAQAVFQDRIKQFGRFRAVRFGFKHSKAGQPWQVNGFSLSVQDKGLFYGSSA